MGESERGGRTTAGSVERKVAMGALWERKGEEEGEEEEEEKGKSFVGGLFKHGNKGVGR
jgi:hypothetical protein